MPPVIRRKSIRALLITPNQELLMIKIDNNNGDWVGWITPGGGMDEHESETQALTRELFEELGFKVDKLGPAVWKRRHKFSWDGRTIDQEEVYYWLPTPKFLPSSAGRDANEQRSFIETRWFSLEALQSSPENFAPQSLYPNLKKILADGPPPQPIEVI